MSGRVDVKWPRAILRTLLNVDCTIDNILSMTVLTYRVEQASLMRKVSRNGYFIFSTSEDVSRAPHQPGPGFKFPKRSFGKKTVLPPVPLLSLKKRASSSL